MPSIRHHLTMAEAAMTGARAHLESAFEHTIDEGYDSRWTAAIDTAISEAGTSIIQVHNIKTMIEPPATATE
ncbi:hypothetical protein ES703_41073 [subsurface metagenome]